jgi:gas vesicle protein
MARPARSLQLLACVLSAWLLGTSPPSMAAPEKTSKVYRWVDEKGIVHFGDAVPPQYADQEQTILNRRGVAVGSIEGRRSAEQLAADEAAQRRDETARNALQRRQAHDQNLLATYLSVAEIESLRDRRTEILDGQARAISQYLAQLQTRMGQLQEQMQRFRPYAPNAAAPALPKSLADDVAHTLTDVRAQERALASKQEEVAQTRRQFEEDISRFRELKSGAPPR